MDLCDQFNVRANVGMHIRLRVLSVEGISTWTIIRCICLSERKLTIWGVVGKKDAYDTKKLWKTYDALKQI